LAVTSDAARQRPGLVPDFGDLTRLPWWVLIVIATGILALYSFVAKPLWSDSFRFVQAGLLLTIVVSLTAFVISLVLGLLAGLGQLSSNTITRNVSLLYVQVMRGVPLLVQIIFWAFVIIPAITDLLNGLGGVLLSLGIGNLGRNLSTLSVRDIQMTYRAIAALAIGYGAFEAEVFRAGIESIERGQMEAARSLGMSHVQAMRYIILPQAVRVILPPLGNDFIALLKDSSLISVLAVRELTHLGQLHRARTFRSWEALGTVAFLYLILTLSLSFMVKTMERRMSFER
jgi:polar amino acid transport system permease protein